MRLISWDLETSNLDADFGTILCAGWKVIGEGKPQVISLSEYPSFKTDPTNDKALLKDFTKILLGADVWVTWFGTYFDIPFLNARLLANHLPVVPPNFPHIDGWKTARNRLKLSNNRLNTVQSFLELEDEKSAVKGPIWRRAKVGHLPSLKYIIHHCKKDVLVLEQAYYRLLPLIIDHPNSGLMKDGQCPACASDRLQKRGFHIAKTRRYQRYQCQNCGAWSRNRLADRTTKITL